MNATITKTPTAGSTRIAKETCDTDILNKLLRGEISAVETYDQAMQKFAGQSIETELREIRDEHQEAVAHWRDRVMHFGAEPVSSSGAWGTFAATVTGTAKIIGPETVLEALRKGEGQGIGDYEEALENPKVDEGCKTMIRDEFLLACREHQTELDRMMKNVGK